MNQHFFILSINLLLYNVTKTINQHNPIILNDLNYNSLLRKKNYL